jgi:hypothetical protein
MSTQERIRQALDDLARAPAPANLADRALRAAGRRRATTIAGVFGAGTVALTLVAVGLAGSPRPSGVAGLPTTGASSGPAQVVIPEPCVTYTSGGTGLAEVPRDQWPDFVTAAVAALPARSDYSMQSGYAWCDLSPELGLPETANGWKISSAIVNLGRNREHGLVVIDISVRVPHQPTSCAEVSPPEALLFCTPGTPLTYAYGQPESVVTAVYGGGIEIRMTVDGDALMVEQVAAAAADPGLYATIQTMVPAPTS